MVNEVNEMDYGRENKRDGFWCVNTTKMNNVTT